jgi:transcription initiation factor TFIID subunit TAF12
LDPASNQKIAPARKNFPDKSSKCPAVRSQCSAQLVSLGLAQFYPSATKLRRGMRLHAQFARYRSKNILSRQTLTFVLAATIRQRKLFRFIDDQAQAH